MDVGLATPDNVAVFAVLLSLLLSMVITEWMSIHAPYSKFAKPEAIEALPIKPLQKLFNARMGSRLGFFLLYFFPLVFYLIIWGVFAARNLQTIGSVAPSPGYSVILLVGWCISFAKRCFEVLFVHVYSGDIPVASTVVIAVAYSGAGLAALFFSNQVVGYVPFSPQTIAKDIICFIFYFVGITVNATAHLQLRFARTKRGDAGQGSEKKYLSPSEIGLLFRIFICPHYVFEVLLFIGWGMFGATSVHYMTCIGMLAYLSSRTRATYKWYAQKGLLRSSGSQNKTSLLSSAAQVGDA